MCWAKPGGQAYVYDVGDNFDRRYNSELIAVRRLQGDGDDAGMKHWIAEHFAKTGSQRAKTLLDDWESQRQCFWHVTQRVNMAQIEAANEGADRTEPEGEKVAG